MSIVVETAGDVEQQVFTFSIDQKQSSWDKTIYRISADSYEDAEKIAKDVYERIDTRLPDITFPTKNTLET